MSRAVKVQILFLWEHELRLASKTLADFRKVAAEKGNVPDEEYVMALTQAINACETALYQADDESRPLMLTRAKDLLR